MLTFLADSPAVEHSTNSVKHGGSRFITADALAEYMAAVEAEATRDALFDGLPRRETALRMHCRYRCFVLLLRHGDSQPIVLHLRK